MKAKRLMFIPVFIAAAALIILIFRIVFPIIIQNMDLMAAKQSAAEYIADKYGVSDKPSSSEFIYTGGGLFGPPRRVAATKVDFEGYSVIMNDGVMCDNRQYGDICDAIKKEFIDDKSLGASFTGEAKPIFAVLPETDCSEYTADHFGGNIRQFLGKNPAALSAYITYEGYPEKRDKYRDILNDKFSCLSKVFDGENSNITLLVKSPGLELPKSEHKLTDETKKYPIPRYEDYMELLACGYMGVQNFFEEDKTKVYSTEFYELDEYTAVSDEVQPITDASEVNYETVDLSDNTTALRGRYRYDSHANEETLNIRNSGIKISLNGRGAYNMLVRLDREHYNIDKDTVPLIVSDFETRDPNSFDSFVLNRYYLTVGYKLSDMTDANYDDWYYLDDKYLYLYISSVQSDFNSNDFVITFAK